MEFLIGKPEDFVELLESMTPEDNVALLTHADSDGLVSAIFLEEILKNKGIAVKSIYLVDYSYNMFKGIIQKLKEQNISKVIVSDLNPDRDAKKDFEEVKKEIATFIIDHHPINENLENKKNIIKTSSHDCSALVIYNLGKEFNLFDYKKWEFLICAVMIAEFSYKNPENLKFIKKIYPEITIENIKDSIPEEKAKEIGSALIYFQDNKKKVYDLVKKQDFKEIKKAYEIVENEIQKKVKEYEKNAEFYIEKNIYFGFVESKLNVASIVASILSERSTDSTILVSSNLGDLIKISARNQSGNKNMNLLMIKGIKGLKNATAGGHPKASAARIQKKDFEAFKKNILED